MQLLLILILFSMQLVNNFLKDYRKMFRLIKSGETFVALDTETTGFNCLTDRIIELGAVKFNYSGVLDTFQTLVNPLTPIPSQITEITGINDEMVCKSPTVKECLPDFLKFCEKTIIIGHNVQFDLRFLKVELERINKKELNNPAIDTLQFARWAFPLDEKFKQTVLAQKLGVTISEAHRAGDDAWVCGNIFLRLIKATASRQKI